MPIKHTDFVVQGMFRDFSEHAFDNKFAYENQNLRITTEPNASGEHTGDMYSLTNEKGNRYTYINGLENGNMKGVPIGQCLINNQWVVFMIDRPPIEVLGEETIGGVEGEESDLVAETSEINNLITSNNCRIYKLWIANDEMQGELLYEGKLCFDYKHPIETLPYYENEQIQKVYWTDGLNQPRFINIAENAEKRAKWTDTSFDFIATMDLLSTTVNITEYQVGGNFPAGVIQWFFTYSRQFGQETNIFASTGLYELKHPDRGAAPDETTSQSFKIRLEYLDDNFDFVNVYSVIRTSIDGTPIAKCVGTFPISTYNPYEGIYIKYIETTDSNLYGYTIDPQELFYKGGEPISAYTMEQKDNTLFFGNYTLIKSYIPDEIKRTLKDEARSSFIFTAPEAGSNKLVRYEKIIKGDGFYHYGNKYRIGIQFQHMTGRWSEVVWLGDYICNVKLTKKWTGYGELDAYSVPYGELTMGANFRSAIRYIASLGYVKVRPVVVYPNRMERKFVAQGVLADTIRFTQKEDYRYPDYFFRFANKNAGTTAKNPLIGANRLWYNKKCVYNPDDESVKYTSDEYSNLPKLNEDDNNLITISNDIYDLYTPDLEFDDGYKISYDNSDMVLSISNYVRYLINRKSENEITTSSISKPTVGHNAWYSPVARQYVYNKWNSIDVDDIITYNVEYDVPEESGQYHYTGTASRFKLYSNTGNTIIVPPFENDSYAFATYPDTSDLYTYDAVYPNRIPSSFNIMKMNNYHYVGGYLWEDTFQNIVTRHSELTDADVPNGASSFMQYFWQWIYPVFIWQASGSICYDNSKDKSSVLKSNKTLNYMESGDIYDTDRVSTNVNVIASYGMDVKKLTDVNTTLLYSSLVNDILNWTDTYSAVMNFKPKSSFSWVNCHNKRYERHTLTNYFVNDNLNEFSSLPYDGVTEESGQISQGTRGFNWTDVKQAPAGETSYLKRSAIIKYNSTPHFVIVGNVSDVLRDDEHLPLCDLEQTIPSDIYGGTTDDVLQRNDFLIAGKAVNIVNLDYTPKTETGHIKVEWKIGDVYLREYECLKTYPVSFEDENCVTEVLNVAIQTYYNLNGRYDTWKGNPTFSTSPANWNLMNPVYNQKDNFFVYHGLDLSVNSINSFPNSFTWSLTKWSGSTVDKWTQITMASTMDVDGTKGEITKLVKLQDNLLCFQPKAMSQILYNEREQIATGSGVPVELANSGKVNGVRYITENTGCYNKWSICKTESGLYWIDDENKQICAWNQQLAILSNSLGFHSWINEKSKLELWNSIDFNSFVTYYDPYIGSVMFFFKDNMLSYNTQLNCFDSFFSYGHVPYYMAFKGTAFTLSDKDSDGEDTFKVWEQHKGNYNYFYVHDECIYDGDDNLLCKGRIDKDGNPTDYGYEPYHTTLLVNPDMPYDKVFTNVDMRTDMWNVDKELLEETFSHIEVWNEYQHNKSQLIRQIDIPNVHTPEQHSILKKKFRVWYIDMPRDKKVVGSRYYNRDRMRNTWLYLKLSKELINNDPMIDYPYISDNRHVIHHIGVSYFV